MNKIKTVKEIRHLIDQVILPSYKYKTNFSSPEFMVDINNKLIINAKPKILEKKVIYGFVLDTQFLSNKEISSAEIKMVNNILTIFIKDFPDQDYLNDDDIYNYDKRISNILFNRYIALEGKFIK